MAHRTTPLRECFDAHGARVVPFAGWEMPVAFEGGVIAEHQAVRTGAGLFDVSHMGRFAVEGDGALDFLDGLLTNDPRRLDPDQLMYTALCKNDGGTIDDLVVYRCGDGFLVVANAANREAVFDWFRSNAENGIVVEERTEALAQLAVQGPKSPEALARAIGSDCEELGYYRYTERAWEGSTLLVSRNGYTGEDGFEIYVPAERAAALWRALVAGGARPAGLGARDTLRLEVGYPLYGHELSREITPVEAGLGWVVKTKGRSFSGHERLRRQKKEGTDLTLVGLEFDGRIIGRQGAAIREGAHKIGEITSGTFGPSVQKGIALALVEPAYAEPGRKLQAEVRGRSIGAEVVKLPFYTGGSHR